MDPLSDVLSLLRPRTSVSSGFDAGGDWSVEFTDNVDIKCDAVLSGRAWLSVDGVPEAVQLEAGDCFLLPSGRPFRLTSDLALVPDDARTIYPPEHLGGVVTVGTGGDFFAIGSRFALSGKAADFLLSTLPPIIHIHRPPDRAALRWCVERMRQEVREGQPGSDLVAQHLAHMMLIQALRVHLAQGSGGWLYALANSSIRAAIGAMHGDPARRWSVQELAEQVGMSRSAFALTFKQTVGVPPLDYLTRWRMLLAGDRMERTNESVSAISLDLGYQSESAFGTAFKRVMGCSPRQYSRARPVALRQSPSI